MTDLARLGLGMAPAIAAGFGATIFMLIKLVVHMRKNPVPWAVFTSPAFFLIAGTVCTLSIVYKGSPNLKLNDRPPQFIAGVTVGAGAGLCILSAVFFLPFLYCRVIRKDNDMKSWEFIKGPLLLTRPIPLDATVAKVPNYAVVQHDEDDDEITAVESPIEDPKYANEKSLAAIEANAVVLSHKQRQAEGTERLHVKLRKGTGPLGWAMRFLHENKIQSGAVYETKNMIITLKRIPAMVVVAALYGSHFDIHAAQTGIAGTPEGKLP